MKPYSLSVCIPVLNRVDNLKHCVEVLDKLHGIDEIVVADNMSTDTDYAWFKKPNHKLVQWSGDWSIGRAKNVAAQASEGDILFFLDADLVVPQEIIDKIRTFVPMGYVYSPIMFMENEQGAPYGEWAISSFGQIAVTREQWENRPWPEWTSYGGDDNYFFHPYKYGKYIRDQVFDFNHQWHNNEERTKNYKDEAGVHLTQWNKELKANE
jgi:glycosyltransferase involved in cell wall biosynthesis